MNVYTSDAVEFFTVVLTSGLIALAALTIASAIAFLVTFAVFRERALATRTVDASGTTRDEAQRFTVESAHAARNPVAVVG